MGVVVWLQTCLSGVTFINESHEVPTGKLFLLLLLSLFLSLSLSHDLCSRTHKCTLSSSHTQILSLSFFIPESSFSFIRWKSFRGTKSSSQSSSKTRTRRIRCLGKKKFDLETGKNSSVEPKISSEGDFFR